MGLNGNLTTLYTYNQYDSGISAESARSINYALGNQSNGVYMSELYRLSMSDSIVCSINVSLLLSLVGSSFQLSPSVGIFKYEFTLPEAIQSYFDLYSTGEVFIMQTSNYETYLILYNRTSLGFVSASLSNR